MSKTTTAASQIPVDTSMISSRVVDPELVALRAAFDDRRGLDELARNGAQKMLQQALEAEVQEFLQRHGDHRDDLGRRLVVGNGYLSSCDVLTGAGLLQVR